MIFFLLLTSVIAGGVLYIVLTASFAYARSRGKRLVTCPETGNAAAVALASSRAALAAPFGGRPVELSACSRWPEKAGCGRECLSQIAEAPDGCLVRAMVERWYEPQSCVFCGRSFARLSLAEHRPALLPPEGGTLRWSEVRTEELPKVLASHKPVCWNCHVVQTVVQKRPDLVVVRPAHPDPQRLAS